MQVIERLAADGRVDGKAAENTTDGHYPGCSQHREVGHVDNTIGVDVAVAPDKYRSGLRVWSSTDLAAQLHVLQIHSGGRTVHGQRAKQVGVAAYCQR